jgi:putative NADPH-quinone reductase
LAFLDLSKAFDRVWRDGLFALLWENGIKGKCWRLLRKMYEKVENKVIFGDFESDWFDQEFGLKQGCVCPYPFFYFNDGFSKHARK